MMISLAVFPTRIASGYFLSNHAGLAPDGVARIVCALIGEIIGTGIIGSLLAYPVASLFMGKNVAVFTYLIPFLISCTGGAIIAYVFFSRCHL